MLTCTTHGTGGTVSTAGMMTVKGLILVTPF